MSVKKQIKKGVEKKTLVVPVLLVVAIAVSFFVYSDTSVVIDDNKEQTEEVLQKENNELLEKISNHYLLPVGEEPMIATVTDADMLSVEQEFYKDVENGDKVILYIQNQRAIIYSPTKDVIINVGPIISDDSTDPVEELVEEIENK